MIRRLFKWSAYVCGGFLAVYGFLHWLSDLVM